MGANDFSLCYNILNNHAKEYIRDGNAYCVTYDNNDFAEDAKQIVTLSQDDFYRLCKQKYTDTYRRLYSDTLDEIRQKYQDKSERVLQNQEKIAEAVAKKKMDETHGIIVKGKEMSTGETNYDDILDNFFEDSTLPTIMGR